jgi:L-rhamnose mutarotase
MALWSPTTSDPTSPTSPIQARHGSLSFPAGPSIREKYKGRRIAQIVKLKPEFVAKYKECHAKVWPEVLKQIRDCKIEDCAYFFPLNLSLLTPFSLFFTVVSITGYCSRQRTLQTRYLMTRRQAFSSRPSNMLAITGREIWRRCVRIQKSASGGV